MATYSTKQLYKYLYEMDNIYMQNIKQNDKYRIEKALSIYLQTKQIPSEFFAKNPPKPIVTDIKLFGIDLDKDILRQRISLRTKNMIKDGLIDEIIFLEKNYSRDIPPMNSIGIKETLQYLDGKIDKKQLEEKISIATAQLAKRQRTFNKNQFKNINFNF
jgi:tRNA dimethylallyltransferase